MHRIPALEEDITKKLRQQLSLAAFIPKTGQIIGVVINEAKRASECPDQGDCEEGESGDNLKCNQFPTTFKRLVRFFDDLCSDFGTLNVFDEYQISKMLDVFIICTDPNLQRSGVASALFRESVNLAKQNSCDALHCMALSKYTIKICEKFGMKTIARIEYKSYEQDGENIFSAEMGEHDEGKVLILKF